MVRSYNHRALSAARSKRIIMMNELHASGHSSATLQKNLTGEDSVRKMVEHSEVPALKKLLNCKKENSHVKGKSLFMV